MPPAARRSLPVPIEVGELQLPCYSPRSVMKVPMTKKDGSPGFKVIPLTHDDYHLKRGERSSDPDVFTIPCGQCIGCRLERSRQWAVRCMHEASLYEDNCFITLTYSDEHLPSDKSLDVTVFQKFMKRLRKRYGDGIRFYHCGEYGETFARPHYHACLFNFDFSDKTLFKIVNDQRLYVSESLCDLWPFGFSTVGSVTFESAAYVARYIMKKRYGKDAEEYYDGRKPEYTTMSRRPGIGKDWISENFSDVYPEDMVLIKKNGKYVKSKPPRYYDTCFEHAYPEDFSLIKEKREESLDSNPQERTYERLAVKEYIMKDKLKKLVRVVDLEN